MCVISNLKFWANQWRLGFERSKCTTSCISRMIRKNIPYLYHLQGVWPWLREGNKVSRATLIHDLRLNKHPAEVVSQSNKVIGLLRRNLSFCDQKIREAGYTGFVRPILEYASIKWDPHLAQFLLWLQTTETLIEHGSITQRETVPN